MPKPLCLILDNLPFYFLGDGVSKGLMSTLVVDDFDDAVKKVVGLLLESNGTAEGRPKAFLCHGWLDEALGASAVLSTIAKLLKSTTYGDSDTRKHFGRIFYVDCSLWKNRRTLQRAIAEELNLHQTMPIFDKHDEEDDFRGMDDSSREEISSIASLIHESLRNERFLMIFIYGGDEDIDLIQCGVPPFCEGKLLWTYGGRFCQPGWRVFKLLPTSANIDIFMRISSMKIASHIENILYREAAGVIADTGIDGINSETVVDCFLYSLFLTTQLPENFIHVDYGWVTHACNYWICDGILGEDKAWEIGNALYGVIPRFDDSDEARRRLASCLVTRKKSYKGWYSVTSDKRGEDDISNVSCSASSYFLSFQGYEPVYVRNDVFQLASRNLRVLKLRNCSFDFASPPFGCCN